MKVVVADDSRLIRGIIDKTVAAMGFEVIQAGNGREALDLLEPCGNDISMVLLDWNMPVMSGLEVLKCIRRDNRFQHILVLMVSTESEDERIMEALQAGAQGYLTKPFTPEKLTDAIKMVLDTQKKT